MEFPNPHPEFEQIRSIEKKLDNLIAELKTDIQKIENPQAAALYETSAEVLTGLKKAFTHFADKSEEAWQKP